MRFIHLRKRGTKTVWSGIFADMQEDITRCADCCEGNNVNELLEIQAIKRYIALAAAAEKAGQE